MRHITAAGIMSRPVVCIRPDASIQEAVRKMRRLRVSGLPVLDRSGRCIGIISEGDITRLAAGIGGLNELSYARATEDVRELETTVGEVMTRKVVTTEEETPAREIARLMHRHAIKRVPIVRDEGVIGIVTRADILGLYDRTPGDVASDVRRTMCEDLLMDPARYAVEVRDGVVGLHGPAATDREIYLIQAILADVDGVIDVDVSGLRSDTPLSA